MAGWEDNDVTRMLIVLRCVLCKVSICTCMGRCHSPNLDAATDVDIDHMLPVCMLCSKALTLEDCELWDEPAPNSVEGGEVANDLNCLGVQQIVFTNRQELTQEGIEALSSCCRRHIKCRVATELTNTLVPKLATANVSHDSGVIPK